MDNNVKASNLKVYFVPIVIAVVLGVIFFLPARTFKYWNAWLYLSIITLVTFFIAVYFSKKSPDLLMRRQKIKENTQNKVLTIYNYIF